MAASKIENAPWVRLGDYIERSMVNNSDLKYGTEFIEGVNSNGEFCKTKADLLDINLKPYKLVNNGDFVYNPSRFNIGSIAYRTTGFCIVSHLYVVFRLNELGKEKINPLYLYMYIYRDEFFRMITYLNFGSQRPEFNFFELSEIKIPLPSIQTQRELVAVYNGLKELAEENEKLLEPLSKSFQAFIADCKKKYEKKRLGNLIEDIDIKNSDNKIKAVKSVSVTKEFKETGAKVNKEELGGYKLVPPRHISYVQTTKNEKCFANVLNTSNETYVVTSVNKVIKSKDENILDIGYLHLFLRREEFDRYAIFNYWGSAREVFSYEDFRDVQIPLPPIQVQQKIVDLYDCYEECKRIANAAREKIKNICHALVQKAAHTN